MDKQHRVLLTEAYRGVTIMPHAEVFWAGSCRDGQLGIWGFCGVQLRGGGVTSPLKMRPPTLAGCIMHIAGIASFHLEMDDLVQVVAEVF